MKGLKAVFFFVLGFLNSTFLFLHLWLGPLQDPNNPKGFPIYIVCFIIMSIALVATFIFWMADNWDNDD